MRESEKEREREREERGGDVKQYKARESEKRK